VKFNYTGRGLSLKTISYSKKEVIENYKNKSYKFNLVANYLYDHRNEFIYYLIDVPYDFDNGYEHDKYIVKICDNNSTVTRISIIENEEVRSAVEYLIQNAHIRNISAGNEVYSDEQYLPNREKHFQISFIMDKGGFSFSSGLLAYASEGLNYEINDITYTKRIDDIFSYVEWK
jgi:hypothetical protein